MKIPGGKKLPLGRLIWSLPSGVPLTPETAPMELREITKEDLA